MADALNLNQLRAFFYAAQYGSITLASEQLFTTQPAVSMQIKGLETQYGVQLFVRSKKKLQLTEAGKGLYRVAVKIFGLVAEAEQVLIQAKELDAGFLRFGSTKTLVRYVLAKHISRFQKAFPRIQIQIHEGSSQEMVRSVLENQNDFAIVGRVEYDEKLEVIPLIQDELVLLVAPGHRLCEKEEVSLHDLAGENLILRERGSGTRRLIERVLRNTDIISSAYVESDNVDFIKELVAMGNGVTLLAGMGADLDVSRGALKILPLREGVFVLDIDIVINRERPLSNADKAFLDVLRDGKNEETTTPGRSRTVKDRPAPTHSEPIPSVL
jgi:LysR family transcriptional regulator, transcriptional activator of the cysJI operon